MSMADIFSREKRSQVMSLIKGKNTMLERSMFRRLRAAGMSFQKHYGKVSGRPDIAMPKKKIAVFVDSKFWHGWRYPAWRHKLSMQWQEKIERNRRNDQKVTRSLRRKGWTVIRVWEHHMKRDLDSVVRRIGKVLNKTI